MKRRDALTALAAVPLAALASSAQGQERRKKAKAQSDVAAPAEEAQAAEAAEESISLARFVDHVDLQVHTQTMPMGPPMYSGTIRATVTVPSDDWRVLAVQAVVVRSGQQYGPVTLVKDEFSGKYLNNFPLAFPGAVAGNAVVAKVLAVYEVKTRGESESQVLP